MKKFLLTPLLVFLLVTVVSTSCSEDDAGPQITAGVGRIVATIDGDSFDAAGGAQIYNDEIMLGGNMGIESISVIITKAAAVGTYDVKGAALGVTTPDAQVNYQPQGGSLFSSSLAVDGETVGTVTITEIDETNKTISGTFNSKVIEGSATKEITKGSFNKIPYSTQPPSALSAKINGTPFAASVVLAHRSAGWITINGQTLNGSQIFVFNFDDNIAVGAHSIGSFDTEVYVFYTASLSTFVSTSGTMTITKHDTAAKRVEGTFSFESEGFTAEGDGPTITEGSFAVSYN